MLQLVSNTFHLISIDKSNEVYIFDLWKLRIVKRLKTGGKNIITGCKEINTKELIFVTEEG
jgi:hypothetical protein